MVSTKSRNVSAFTLVETLTVLLIIALLTALITGVVGYVNRKADGDRARVEISSLESAIEWYKLDTGAYPTSGAVRALLPLAEMTNSWMLYSQLTSGPKKYYNFRPSQLLGPPIIVGTVTNNVTVILDPWNRPYNYYCRYPLTNAQVNMATFDLWSYGPNFLNNEGSLDDIANWK